MTYWKRLYGGSCESRMLGSYPEYFNAFSSLFIFSVGFLYLLLTNLEHLPMRIAYSSLSFNGIGSFLYHYYGYAFYSSLDINPIFLTSWTFSMHVWLSCISFGKLRDFIVLFCVTWFLFSISITSYKGFKGPLYALNFLTLFIIPQVVTIVGIVTMLIIHHRKIFINRVCNWRLIIYSLIGVLSLVSGVIVWTLTEPKCEKEVHPSYNGFLLVSHAWWHISFIYGFHLIFQVILYLTSEFQSYTSNLIPSEVLFLEHPKSTILNFLLLWFPVVCTRRSSDIEEGVNI